MLLPKLPPLLMLPFGSLEFNEILKLDNTSRCALNSMNGDFNPRHLKNEEREREKGKMKTIPILKMNEPTILHYTKYFLQ